MISIKSHHIAEWISNFIRIISPISPSISSLSPHFQGMPQLGTLTLPTATSSSEGIEGISRKVLEPRPPVPVDQIRVQRERERIPKQALNWWIFSGTNTITRLIGILMAYSWNCNGIQKGLLLYVKVRMLFQPHQLGKNHVPRWHGGYSGWSHPTVLHLMVAQLHDNLVGGFNHSEKY